MDELKHFGVSGMHWGHHKNMEKADAKWQKKVLSNSMKHFVDAHNKSLPEINKFLGKLNSELGNKKLNTGDDPSKWNARTKAYVKAHDVKYRSELNKHLNSLVSPSGKHHLTAEVKDGNVNVVTKERNLK
jgi:hypothetical protein